MLQVDKAYEHLVNYANAPESNVRFVLSCSGSRGIYLREAHQTSKASEHVVVIEPKHRETDAGLFIVTMFLCMSDSPFAGFEFL